MRGGNGFIFLKVLMRSSSVPPLMSKYDLQTAGIILMVPLNISDD